MINDVQFVRDNERILLARRWDSDLGKQLAHQALNLRGREADPSLSIPQQDELADLVLSSGGDRAIAHLGDLVAEAESRVAFFATQYATKATTGFYLRDALPAIQAQIALARTYRSRLAILKSKRDGTELPPVELAPTSVEEAHRALLAAAGQVYIDDLTRNLASMEEEIGIRFQQVLDDIEAATTSHASGPRNEGLQSEHDAIWDRLSWLIWRRGDLAAKIAKIGLDSANAVKVQADAVSAVVAAVGGKAVVIKAITDSRMMRDRYWAGHPEWSGVQATGSTLASIDAQLARLGGKDAVGPLADQLRADRQTVEASWESNSVAVDRELQAQIAAELDAAMAGDEPARVAIMGDALAEPRAFPSGFSDQLDAAMFPRTREGSALLALVLSTGLPLS